MNTLFPIFLKGDFLKFLIVGGGNVGLEKLEALLKNSPEAKVTLVAPLIKDEIVELAKTHTIDLYYEPYSVDFLKFANVVIAGTDSSEVNKQVQQVVAVPLFASFPVCDFFVLHRTNNGSWKAASGCQCKQGRMHPA